YRTAHLIMYHFIHLEGDAGVAKIWKAMADNRESIAAVKDYQAKFKVFQAAIVEFKRLPGDPRPAPRSPGKSEIRRPQGAA
ncbi:MAG: hypothetical protein RLZZ522_1757, partial [Verrucomicrobiota bacterium]